MEKREMVEALVGHFGNGNKAKFAALLGIKPQSLSMWISRNTLDAELIYQRCKGVSAEWLLSGDGNMLLEHKHSAIASGSAIAVNGSHNDVGNVTISEVASDRIALLERLLEEKERVINILMDRR